MFNCDHVGNIVLRNNLWKQNLTLIVVYKKNANILMTEFRFISLINYTVVMC